MLILSDMALTGHQTLNFYEDLYLRASKRSVQLQYSGCVPADGVGVLCHSPSLSSPPPTKDKPRIRHERVHSSDDGLRDYVRSGRQHSEKLQSLPRSVTSNLTYDSMPAQSLGLKPAVSSQRNVAYQNDEYNNNHYELIDNYRSAPEGGAGGAPTRGSNSSNYATLPPRLHRQGKRSPDDHIYEVIPHQNKSNRSRKPLQQQSMSVDDDNYWIPNMNSRIHVEEARLRWNSTHKPTARSNLRSMKSITRSVDSLRGSHHQGNKLRNQATNSQPYLWMKTAESGKLPNAASCSNISESVLGFGRLTHGVEAFDKENSLPTNAERTPVSSRGRYDSASSSSQSIRRKRSDDELSQKSSSNSLQSAGSRSSVRKLGSRQYSKPPPPLPTDKLGTYENIYYSNASSASSNYVNVTGQPRPCNLDYADLDFTVVNKTPTASSLPRTLNTARCVTPISKQISVEHDDPSVEYTEINITATEAARRACEEQRRYRQRKSSASSRGPVLERSQTR